MRSLRPQPQAARSATVLGPMGAPRHPPRVLPRPPPGLLLLLLLLLLSGPAPGGASPRLLDHPAPVCSQQVRPAASRRRGSRQGAAGPVRRGGQAAGAPGPRRAGGKSVLGFQRESAAWAQGAGAPGRTRGAVGVLLRTREKRNSAGKRVRGACCTT